jgi:hypothetical protein
MGKRTQPKLDQPTTVTTEIEEDHYRIKNWVAREWSPIIGSFALHLYNIYCSAANRELGNKWFFSVRTLEEFTLLNHNTINMNNWLLEICGLIRIDSGNEIYANEYVLLPPPHVTDETLKPIIATLKAEAKTGKNWQAFKANALARIMRYKPLHECGKVSQFKKIQLEAGQPPLFSTNGHAPHAESADLPTHDELVARLVRGFADAEPPLTEAAAIKMIEQYGIKAVKQQCDWVNYRVTDNPLRTLRAALKGNWSEPKPVGKAEPSTFTKEELEYILSISRFWSALGKEFKNLILAQSRKDAEGKKIPESLRLRVSARVNR